MLKKSFVFNTQFIAFLHISNYQVARLLSFLATDMCSRFVLSNFCELVVEGSNVTLETSFRSYFQVLFLMFGYISFRTSLLLSMWGISF